MPVLHRCRGVRLTLGVGTRHVRVTADQASFVTRNRTDSIAVEGATRAKDQDNVRAVVGDGGPFSNADVAAIFCDDPCHIVADGHASGNQLSDARGILCSCSRGIVLAQNRTSDVAEAARPTEP
jgi:hypothetical protein